MYKNMAQLPPQFPKRNSKTNIGKPYININIKENSKNTNKNFNENFNENFFGKDNGTRHFKRIIFYGFINKFNKYLEQNDIHALRRSIFLFYFFIYNLFDTSCFSSLRLFFNSIYSKLR